MVFLLILAALVFICMDRYKARAYKNSQCLIWLEPVDPVCFYRQNFKQDQEVVGIDSLTRDPIV